MKALKKYLGWIAVACAVVAVIMCALPFAKMGDDTLSGFEAMFGYEESAGGVSIKMFGFSVMNLLPLLLVVVAAVCAYLGKKKGNKIMNYVAIACFAVAAILFFCAVNFLQAHEDYKKFYETMTGASNFKEMWKEFLKEMDLGIGAILAGIVSILGAAAVAVDTFVPVKE